MHRHRKTVDLKCQRQLEINQIAQRTFCAAGKENVRIKSRSRNGDLYEYYEFDCRGTRQKNKSKEISVEEAVTAALDAIEKKKNS